MPSAPGDDLPAGVLAACANATSSVLQRKAGRKVPQGENLSPRLIWGLLHEPGPRSGQSSALQAAVLAVGAGAAFGLTAALMKGMTSTYSRGMVVLLSSWQLYGMVGTGIAGIFLVQSALNAGRLVAAQPGLTLTDPIVSILWGVLVFREQVRTGWFLVLTVVGGLVLVGAVLVLGRSPLLSGESGRKERRDEDPARGRSRSAKR